MNARVLAVLGVIAALAIVAAGWVYAVTRSAVQRQVTGRPGIRLDGAHASFARGEYLYQTSARCASCHARDLGGAFVLNDPLVGTLWGPNLTRANASVGVAYADADFERAIRRGLRPNGQRLLSMPSRDYVLMSDDDVASLIAYIRAAKPVDRPVPPFRLGVLGRLMLVTGKLGFDADTIADTRAAPRSVPPERYATRIAGCLRCHTAGALAAVAPAAFAAVLRTGTLDGRTIGAHAPTVPAWHDDDIAAIERWIKRRASRGS